MGDPLTLYMIDTHSCDIQEDIDQVVLEEIHLIDIENLLMSTSQDTGREAQLSRRQSMLHIDRANELILRRSYRQLHNGESLEELTQRPYNSRLCCTFFSEDKHPS